MDPLQEAAQLRKENDELRKALEQALAKGRSNKKLTCLILTPILLVGIIGVVTVIAAITLPMLSTFKQKQKVKGALVALSGSQLALMGHFESIGSFDGIEVNPGGGYLTVGGESIGAELSSIAAMEWTAQGEGNTLQIQFHWDTISGCPSQFCDGVWELKCNDDDDTCTVHAEVGTDNGLGLNF